MPWEAFLSEGSGDINSIWETKKQQLPRRISFVVNNTQLIRRSAEDAKQDARQWAAEFEDTDAAHETIEFGDGSSNKQRMTYRSDDIGNTTRLIEVLRTAIGNEQLTKGSTEISTVIQQLCQFQVGGRLSDQVQCNGSKTSSMMNIPSPDQLRSIKMQQGSLSREREKTIQGIQMHTTPCAAITKEDEHVLETDIQSTDEHLPPSTTVQLGTSTSFSEGGRQLAQCFSLNKRQSIALRLICRQLDRLRRDEARATQLCQFIGGEGGTGKSRVIEAIVQLFALRGISHRVLVTATSGAAAARINGITIHSACHLLKDVSRMKDCKDMDGLAPSSTADIYIDGEIRMTWQEKYMLILDEVSMLGMRTLFAVNKQLQKLRGCEEDFGGIPIILFCGDFHQFRPVQERSILLPSSAFPWNEEKTFKIEQRYEHDKGYRLWQHFSTVVILKEQVRAAGDQRLQRLLSRIRQGIQDQSDLNLLNSTCYHERTSIPWDSGINVVTPLNKNRWNLNFEATIAFKRRQQMLLHIFISDHKWKNGEPTEEEALKILTIQDDSNIPVPGIFLFVPNMPVIVNRNTYQGLKVVNGASYEAVDIIVDRAYPGHQVTDDIILHFGPPAGIVLAGESTRDFHFVCMPPGTVLLTPVSTPIPCQKKRPWQRTDVTRRGLPCTAAFSCTDYKVQGGTFDQVALELRGTSTININGVPEPTRCDAYALNVQLSRCRSLDGIMLVSKIRGKDFIGNRIPNNMLIAEERLDCLSEATIEEAEKWDWNDV